MCVFCASRVLPLVLSARDKSPAVLLPPGHQRHSSLPKSCAGDVAHLDHPSLSLVFVLSVLLQVIALLFEFNSSMYK